MKAKQISNRIEDEEVIFANVLNHMDDSEVISFFHSFLDLTPTQIRSHNNPDARKYHKIAKQMLPLDA
jgi:hypothetical protein